MLVGRDSELETLAGVLSGAETGLFRVAIVSGEAGSGKTSLLHRLVADAADRSFRVIDVSGDEFGGHVAFSALRRLVDPILSGSIGALTADQREALESAFGNGYGEASPLTVGAAALALVAHAAERRNILIVIDDAHWIDSASASAMLFVVRHLQRDSAAAAIAVRSDVRSTFDQLTAPVVALGGLPRSAASELLGRGRPMPDEVLDRCIAGTGGNPLALNELALVLTPAQLAGTEPLPEPLPIVHRFTHRLPTDAMELPTSAWVTLCLAAADDTCDVSAVVSAAASLSEDPDGDLAAAVSGGLLSIQDQRIVWRHPLYRSAAYYQASESLRRSVHEALAGVVRDPERRVWHLSRAANGKSGQLSDELADVGRESMQRGALDLAGDAFSRASELNPDDRRVVKLLSDAGRCYVRAGSLAKARVVLERGCESVRSDEAGDLMVMLVQEELWRAGPPGAAALAIRHARSLASDNPTRVLLLSLAAGAEMLGGRVARVKELGEEALALGSDHLDPIALLVRDSILACGLSHCGQRERSDRLLDGVRDGIEFGMVAAPEEIEHLVYFVASADISAERFGLAERSLRTLTELGHRRGFETGFASVLLGDVLWRTGRWSESSAIIRDVAQRTEHTDLEAQSYLAKAMLARAEAAYGFSSEADALQREAHAYGRKFGSGVITSWALAARGLNELAQRRPHDAGRALGQLAADVRAWGSRDPGSIWWAGDYLDALRATSASEAQIELDALEDLVALTGSTWGRAVSLRHRALAGEPDTVELLTESIALLEQLQSPFERLHSLAALGVHLEASLGSGTGRKTLLDALRGYEELGARPWAAQLRSRLTGGPDVPPPPTPLRLALSDAELRVALAVGEGKSNKAAAQTLYVSPKTIEFHLQNIFRKLGVRNRNELVVRVVTEHTLSGSIPGPAR